MMKRFIKENEVMKISLPNEFLEEFSICSFQESFVGSLGSDASLSSSAVAEPSISLPKNHVRCVFNTSEISELKEFFSTLYPGDIEIDSTYKQYSLITFNGKTHWEVLKVDQRVQSIVFAEYNGDMRPGRINFFATISVLSNGNLFNPTVVYLSWFAHHDQKNACGKPVTIWEHNLFDSSSFLSLSAVKCRTDSLVDKLDDTHGKVLFVSPYQ